MLTFVQVSRDVRAAGTYEEVSIGFHHICALPIKGADSFHISLFVVTKKFDIPVPGSNIKLELPQEQPSLKLHQYPNLKVFPRKSTTANNKWGLPGYSYDAAVGGALMS